MRHYYPDGLYVWDTWFLNDNGNMHVFHLQMKRPESVRSDELTGTIGHAVSDDLIHWKELPTALFKGSPGSYDEGLLFTGCVVKNDGTWYLYYSNNHHENGRTVSGMCLATSTDGVEWVKHVDNPIITPDPRWYHTAENGNLEHYYHCYPDVDCRDLMVIKDPEGPGWLGYVVVRLKSGGMYDTCCIALLESEDLVHWESSPPCCVPGRFVCFEVPDVFELDGKWYMIALTGDGYGQRMRWNDPYVRHATVVFQSDNPRGPFVEVCDNLLLAANDGQGFSVRTVEYNGERLMFYTRAEYVDGNPTFGRLSLPIKLESKPSGGLLPKYWSGADAELATSLSSNTVNLICERGWAFKTMSVLPESRTVMLNIQIDLQHCKAAGIALCGDDKGVQTVGLLALLDMEQNEIQLVSMPGFTPVQRRKWYVENNAQCSLRLVFIEDMVELYCDDILALNVYIENIPTSQAVLFVQEGSASFTA